MSSQLPLRSHAFHLLAWLLLTFAMTPITGRAQTYLRTVPVNSNATLTTALTNALPGDEIVLANGTYAGFTVTKDGTVANPILIRAENQNLATVSSSIIRFNTV